MKNCLTLLLAALLGASFLVGAAPPGVPPAPTPMPGWDPCYPCSLSLTEAKIIASLGASEEVMQTMKELVLEVGDGSNTASYDLEALGVTTLEPGATVTLELDAPNFEPTTAKLDYTLEDGTFRTSTVTIE